MTGGNTQDIMWDSVMEAAFLSNSPFQWDKQAGVE